MFFFVHTKVHLLNPILINKIIMWRYPTSCSTVLWHMRQNRQPKDSLIKLFICVFVQFLIFTFYIKNLLREFVFENVHKINIMYCNPNLLLLHFTLRNYSLTRVDNFCNKKKNQNRMIFVGKWGKDNKSKQIKIFGRFKLGKWKADLSLQ